MTYEDTSGPVAYKDISGPVTIENVIFWHPSYRSSKQRNERRTKCKRNWMRRILQAELLWVSDDQTGKLQPNRWECLFNSSSDLHCRVFQWIVVNPFNGFVDGSHFAERWLFQGQISGSSRWDQEAQSGAWNILPVWSRLSHFSGRHRAGEFSFDSYKWETEARLHFTADIQSFQLSWSICLQLIFYVAEEKAAGKCKPRRHDCLNLKMSGTK